MKTIGSSFLRARHWQLFALFMGLYVLGAVFGFAADLDASPRLVMVSANFIVGETLMVLCVLCFMGWLGSMGYFLNVLKEPSIRSKTGFFWLALIYPLLYIPVFFAFFFSASTRVSGWGIVPAHLFAMVCIFYLLYFASKGLAIAEASRPVTFYDCAGPLFLIWFFPLGIWFVQPKINRLFAKSRRVQAGIQPAAGQWRAGMTR